MDVRCAAMFAWLADAKASQGEFSHRTDGKQVIEHIVNHMPHHRDVRSKFVHDALILKERLMQTTLEAEGS